MTLPYQENRVLIAIRRICQTVRVNPVSTGKLSRRFQRSLAPLSGKSKTNPTEPMETKTHTVHSITTGSVEISGGRILATCQGSGEKYLTDRLMRWDQDRIIKMLSDIHREADAKADAKARA